MPRAIIRPELQPLTPAARNYLITNCDKQQDDVILHYLQTKEIKLTDLPKLSASRKATLQQRYEEWINLPDPEEAEAWNEIVGMSENILTVDLDSLENHLNDFIGRYPMSIRCNDAVAHLREIAQSRWNNVKSQAEENLDQMRAKLARMESLLSTYRSSLLPQNISVWEDDIKAIKQNIDRCILKPYFDQWDAIMAMSEEDIDDMRRKEQRMNDFIHENNARFSNDVFDNFKKELKDLQNRIAYKSLENIRFDFDELIRFIRRQHRESELFRVADEYIWNLIKEELNQSDLRRFINSVPNSSYVEEARKIMNLLNEWEPIKLGGNIFKVKGFMDNNPDLPQALFDVVDNEISRLKRFEINKMRENPSAYEANRFFGLINIGVISITELENYGLVTQESYKKAKDRQKYIEDHPIVVKFVDSPELEAEDITDVYLFGVPSTGKTCVLMGLLGSELFDWNSAIAAGEYGNILEGYRENGTLPNRTVKEVYYSIHGNTKDSKGDIHLINLIELAGEQFLTEIAMNPDRKVSLEHMDSVAAPYFRNAHRKIFFIVIDPTVKVIKYEINGKEYSVLQKTIIKKIVDMLITEANLELMKTVDALHFIATKSDVLDLTGKDILEAVSDYNASFRAVAELSHPQAAHINEATGFKPKLYTFSLGKFYLGGSFDYEPSDSDKLMRIIMENTIPIRKQNFIEKFLDKLNTKVF